MSIASGFTNINNNTRSDMQYDKKVSPRQPEYPKYPMPVTLDNSSIEFTDSVARPFAGISQQQITDLPVDQLYNMMSKNWNKDKILFE